MKLSEFKKKRAGMQKYTWYGLPLVALLGWVYPLMGYLLMGCMVGALGVAAFRGRAWCDWMCPRGAFFDLFVKPVSRRKAMPAFLFSPWTRGAFVALLMGVLGTQVVLFWGDWARVGLAFVMLLTVTTLVGIGLGMLWKERAWCMICPMGTLGALLSKGKEPLAIAEATCTSCAACAKVCPMQINPVDFRAKGTVADADCIKCKTCVSACPKKALEFKKAA